MEFTLATQQPIQPDSPWQHVYDVTISPAAANRQKKTSIIETSKK